MAPKTPMVDLGVLAETQSASEPTTENDPDGISTGFAALGLAPDICDLLEGLGYDEPTPIQQQAIPSLLAGDDVVGQAATGTGKTAAFALPILQSLFAKESSSPQGESQTHDRSERHSKRSSHTPRALVLCPTRELAIQVCRSMEEYGRTRDVRVTPIFGGQPIDRQFRALKQGVDIVVATPGRAIDHLNRGTLDLGGIDTVVLDEADEMLDMGFVEDIETILSSLPQKRQTVLFSATMPSRVRKIANRFQTSPTYVNVARELSADDNSPLITERAYVVARAQKPLAIARLIEAELPGSMIVFCRTRENVDALAEKLNRRGYRAEAIHGGFNQTQRDRVMHRLRSNHLDLLIATDVAARGLDIDHLTHVVNYDVPSSPDTYLHRIGRVGRAGRSGTAITLVEPQDHHKLRMIESQTKHAIKVTKLPSVVDVRERRLEKTVASIKTVAKSKQRFGSRFVLNDLLDTHNIEDIALGTIALLHEAMHRHIDEADDIDLPHLELGARKSRSDARTGARSGGRTGKRSGPRTSPWKAGRKNRSRTTSDDARPERSYDKGERRTPRADSSSRKRSDPQEGRRPSKGHEHGGRKTKAKHQQAPKRRQRS